MPNKERIESMQPGFLLSSTSTTSIPGITRDLTSRKPKCLALAQKAPGNLSRNQKGCGGRERSQQGSPANGKTVAGDFRGF